MGLAILTPYWMSSVLDEQTAGKLAEYARNVWAIAGAEDMNVARDGIAKTSEFFKSLGLPGSLKEIGMEANRLEEIAARVTNRGTLGSFKKLAYEDVLKILQAAHAG